jgi:arabinofuranan 3-O-arabinosyltransferase
VRSVRADASQETTQFPERRPAAALDGDPATAWLADRTLAREHHRLTVRLTGPRRVDALDLLPYSDSRGVVREVQIGGRRFAVGRGWNRLAVRLGRVDRVTVRLSRVTRPREATGSAGGIRELRISGVRIAQALRPPAVLESALRGADLRASALTYLFERATADVPLRRGRYVGERGAGLLRDAQDPEPRLARVFAPPAARRWTLDGWASVDPRASDAALDRLAGTRGSLRVTSASRFQNAPRYRGSGAFDGASRAWVGQWIGGRPAWLAWRAPRAVTVRRLVLAPPGVRVRVPTRVRLRVDGRPVAALAVGAGGAVALPAPVRGRDFRLDVREARFPAGTPARARRRRAVGIGEVRGAGVPALRVERGGAVDLPCGAAAVALQGRRVALGGRVARAALDAGRPLRVRGCGAPVAVPAGPVTLTGDAGPLRADGLRLRSPAPAPRAPAPASGRVLDAGTQQDASRDGVRVRTTAPGWLVLGQSYDAGWRATCDGRDLGRPRPMQGYANAWPVEPGCERVRFAYGPQRAATAGYAVSGLGCLLLFVLLVVSRRRAAAASALAGPAEPLPALPAAPARVPARRAIGIAIAAALVLGFCFGLRAGAVLGPLLGLALYRGIGDRGLTRAATALLAVGVPAAYLIAGALSERGNPGGYDTSYGADRIAAHWLALAALTALGLVLWRTLAAARARRPPPPPDDGDER